MIELQDFVLRPSVTLVALRLATLLVFAFLSAFLLGCYFPEVLSDLVLLVLKFIPTFLLVFAHLLAGLVLILLASAVQKEPPTSLISFLLILTSPKKLSSLILPLKELLSALLLIGFVLFCLFLLFKKVAYQFCSLFTCFYFSRKAY